MKIHHLIWQRLVVRMWWRKLVRIQMRVVFIKCTFSKNKNKSHWNGQQVCKLAFRNITSHLNAQLVYTCSFFYTAILVLPTLLVPFGCFFALFLFFPYRCCFLSFKRVVTILCMVQKIPCLIHFDADLLV